MTYTIALAGKGGTGKTTLGGLVIRWLVKNKRGPILAVDADPNANLNESLGLKVDQTIGGICEELLEKSAEIPASMPKETLMEYRIQEVLVESKGYDLLVMGRPEGPGCYCYANTLVRRYIDILAKNYQYIVMDNEAGMEHLSRRTTQDIDLLLIISDPTLRGIWSAGRISKLVDQLKLRVNKKYLVVNRLSNGLPANLAEEIARHNLELLGTVPTDELVTDYDIKGKPAVELPDDSKAVRAVEEIMGKILGGKK